MVFEPEDCTGRALSTTDYPESAKIVALEGCAAVNSERGRAILWRDADIAGEPKELIATDADILDLATVVGGSHVLAVVSQGPQQSTPCLCG